MFAIIGALLVVVAAILAFLGSFAYPALASVGLLFLAAALASRSALSTRSRVAAVLFVAGLGSLVFGLVATPLFYAGWGLIAGAIAIGLLAGARRMGR